MKKLVTLVALFSMGAAAVAMAETREDVQNRLDNATLVLHQIMSTPDKGIPEEVLEHAKCIAVVPHMIKAGFVFGGENGKGVATCRTADGWSAPVFFAITGGSWGLQIGVEGVDLVMIFQGDKGMQRLENAKFQLGADASAAAGPVGRHATADTDWKLNTEILTYSRAKGAFAGLTLTGADVRRDNDSMDALYGHDVSSHRVLRGEVATPASADAFINAVRDAKAQAIASN
ncbi:MAG: lipid-binding SYLF domain-containing protein [Terracidiphilus sp.]